MIFKPSFIEGDCILCKLLTLHMHCILQGEKLSAHEVQHREQSREGERLLLAHVAILLMIAFLLA